jgi:hypothetical protein
MRADLQNTKKTSESGNITKPGYSVTHGIALFEIFDNSLLVLILFLELINSLVENYNNNFLS